MIYPKRTASKPTELAAYILSRCEPELNTGCLLWCDAAEPYGMLRVDGKAQRVPRLLYEAINGELPDDVLVRHKCDTPPCCNLDHLLPGGKSENMQDCYDRGLRAGYAGPTCYGEDHGQSKLTWEKIDAIRLDRRSSTVIGPQYGVDPRQVRRIRRGEAWKPENDPR